MRVIGTLAVCLEAVLALLITLTHAVLGATFLSVIIVGSLLPLFCALAFVYFCEWRDGRLVFLLVTIMLDVQMCDAFTSIFFSRNDWKWIAFKIALTLLNLLVIGKFFRQPLLEMMETNQISWGLTAAMPLALNVALMGFYLDALSEQQLMPPVPTVVYCAAIVLIYVTLYRFQRAAIEQAQAQQDNTVLRSEITYLHRQVRQEKNSVSTLQIFRHDMRHYAALLRGCLNSGSLDAARDVIERWEQGSDAICSMRMMRRYTSDPILDSVLSQADDRAAEAGIRLDIRLTLPEQMRVDITEFAVVVSNALENAIRAASKVAGTASKVVSVHNIPCDAGMFYLVITNPFAGGLEIDKRTGLPRSNEPGHGYGTRSIAHFAHKYDCLLSCTAEGGVFSLRLLI